MGDVVGKRADRALDRLPAFGAPALDDLRAVEAERRAKPQAEALQVVGRRGDHDRHDLVAPRERLDRAEKHGPTAKIL